MSDIKDYIIKYIKETILFEPKEILLTDNLKDDLQADSLDLVEFMMNLEDHFDISIPDRDSEKFDTVQDVIDYVTEKTK